ncbi:TPA: sigma-70 family RNA polymerase sigma factor, partial [Enterococcus faecalis]|nr:sigma-70 family RNA polymerase sigma factor [Enterococcus faecalis]
KYVEGLTLESIADETGYSYSYIKSKHAEIMRMVQFSKKV